MFTITGETVMNIKSAALAAILVAAAAGSVPALAATPLYATPEAAAKAAHSQYRESHD
jgi:hypothetical protein